MTGSTKIILAVAAVAAGVVAIRAYNAYKHGQENENPLKRLPSGAPAKIPPQAYTLKLDNGTIWWLESSGVVDLTTNRLVNVSEAGGPPVVLHLLDGSLFSIPAGRKLNLKTGNLI